MSDATPKTETVRSSLDDISQLIQQLVDVKAEWPVEPAKTEYFEHKVNMERVPEREFFLNIAWGLLQAMLRANTGHHTLAAIENGAAVASAGATALLAQAKAKYPGKLIE